jgi:polysaccharide pyruvyl transferase WcaK-like protein
MENKSLNILLAHCWQMGNSGDNALWKNMMRRLRESFPDCKFYIASQKIEEWDKDQLKEFKPIYVSMDWTNDLDKVDIVLSQGGGYMKGKGIPRILSKFKIAQDLGKLTLFATQSFVNGIPRKSRASVAGVLNNSGLVVAREKQSFDFLNGIGVKNVSLLPDQVFDVDPEEYKLKDNYFVKIGIRGYLASEDFMSKMAIYADLVSETIGKVLFVPVGHGLGRDDRECALIISSRMKHESQVITDRISAGQLKTILKDGIFVSDRYHGIVCSASMGTPFIALNPDIDYKMPGVIDLFDYPVKMIKKEEMNPPQLFRQTIDIYNDIERYKKILNDRLPKVKQDSSSVYKLIEEKINAYISK